MEKSTATYAGFGQGYAHRSHKRLRAAGPLVLIEGEYTWSMADPSSSVSDFIRAYNSDASSEDTRLLDDHAHALDGSDDESHRNVRICRIHVRQF